MDDQTFHHLSALLDSNYASERLAAMDQITVKRGRRIVRVWDDRRAISLLRRAIIDPDSRVRRAAARGLREFAVDEPGLLESVLPEYAAASFDGRYSHLGLYDTATDEVWVPRLAALRGHAALLKEGNTDRYLKFQFFLPGQAPRYLRTLSGADACGHLVVQLIPEWSYSGQVLVGIDERLVAANLREQRQYAGAVADFYRRAGLRYAVRVHHVSAPREGHKERTLDVELIEPTVTKAQR